jgi:hypothetical protein
MRNPTPDERTQIEEAIRAADFAKPFVPGRGTSWLGFARLRGGGGAERDLLLGTWTRVGTGIALVDWRSAPLAEPFFGCEEGEEYVVEVGGRAVEGTLLRRALLGFEDGALAEVDTGKARLRRRGAGWVVETADVAPRLRPRPPAERGHGGSPWDVELDPVQQAAVALPAGQAALILGEAGCGKTTVALHRLAFLAHVVGRPLRAAVIVPTEGLRALSEALLVRLGVEGVEVWRYDRFAAAQARRAFPDLPRRESVGGSAGVIRLKRHAAIRAALAELARLPAATPPEDRPARRSRALARHDDLHALFGDSRLLARVLDAAGGELAPFTLAETLAHARLQFSPPADEEFAHVDLEARKTSDGRGIDEGTPMEDAATVDVEDYAVMFELDRLRAAVRGGRAATPRTYDCVVVDEAQELAPLELALVGRSVAPGGTLVVAGDADQQLDPAAGFGGWEATMTELGAPGYARVDLEVSYRCPPEVTAFARTLRAEPASERAPSRGPGRVGYSRLESDLHVARWLVAALSALREQDPGAAVAVVCRTAELAARLARAVGFGVDARLALDGRFHFGPGVQVTAVDEVKGLEFDHVIVPDATDAAYPDRPWARRALYVAATRPRHQLVLAGAGPASPLLRALGPSAQ